jgi:hypothetical protein
MMKTIEETHPSVVSSWGDEDFEMFYKEDVIDLLQMHTVDKAVLKRVFANFIREMETSDKDFDCYGLWDELELGER